jgi:hypothetical protein
MLPSHAVKTSSLPLLHLPVMFLSCHLSFWVKTEILNLHHCCRPPSPDSPTTTINWYKKVILTLTTLFITQSYLYFVSSLARAPRHRSSNRRHRSLSLSSYAHRPSAQWHSRWRTSRSSFTFWTTYQHVNSRKYIF